MDVKRISIVIAGGAIGLVVFSTAAATLLWLSCDSKVTVWVQNGSGLRLKNVNVIMPGGPAGFGVDLPPGSGPNLPHASALGTGSPRWRLPFRVVFDSERQHYDIPVEVRLFPLGSFAVSVTIDHDMHISVTTKSVSCI